MAVLRLFAAAREAAGTATDEVPGGTVDEVLDAARARYGAEFARVAAASKVWRNGEPASGDDPVGPGDEVAVLPPVSGGSEPVDPTAPRPRPSGGAPRRRPGPPPSAAEGAPRRPAPSAAPGPAGARPRRPAPPSGRAAPAPRPGGAAPRARPVDPTRARPGGAAPRARPVDPTRARPGGPPPRPRPRIDGPPPGAPAPNPPAPRLPAPRPPAPRRPAPGQLTRTAAVTGTPLAPSEGDTEPATARRLTRLRSVGVPVTGEVKVWGRERQVSGMRQRRTELGRRYGVVYDTSGWKVTLGALWFLAALGATIEGWGPLALLYGVAAGWAALETARRRREVGDPPHLWASALVAGGIGAAGAGGTEMLGAALLAGVVVAVVAAAVGSERRAVLASAGATVLCAVPVGLAAACVVLTRDLEIGAAIVLLVFVSCYEAGDFLIGSGSSNSVEGPLVGILTIVAASLVVAVLQAPPFDGEATFTYAALAAVACPLGQLVASALLPAADARAPALRRLDSLLLLAPVWCWTVGLLMDSAR